MLLLPWGCSNALLKQVENSKKETIAHVVYGRRQKLSCRESRGSEAGRSWGFFLSLDLKLFLLVTGICQSLGVPLKQPVGHVGYVSNWSARTTSGHTASVSCHAQSGHAGELYGEKMPTEKVYGEPRQRALWQEREDSSLGQ